MTLLMEKGETYQDGIIEKKNNDRSDMRCHCCNTVRIVEKNTVYAKKSRGETE